MVIAGTINRVAFYCRVNHRDRDYEKYLDDVMRRLEEEYGKQKWDLQIFFEEASGADPNRKEFNRLKAEIAAKKIDVVVTMRAATIARDWGQFMEFMLICSKRNVEVVYIDKVENAQAIFRRIQEFQFSFVEDTFADKHRFGLVVNIVHQGFRYVADISQSAACSFLFPFFGITVPFETNRFGGDNCFFQQAEDGCSNRAAPGAGTGCRANQD